MDGGQRILIVDDDPAFAKSTGLVLESQGYLVDSAQDGEEALEKMKQCMPDLVLLDVMMDWPLEGVQVSREMMTRKGLQKIPIIMITSILDTEYRSSFPQDEYLHIDAWVNKPVAPTQLIEEVKRILARYEARRSTSAA